MSDVSDNLIAECKRQEESCLYTSTALFEWLKSLRLWKHTFILAPIILGALATWPLFTDKSDLQWITGTCALLAGLAPAIYKGLDLDVGLDVVTKHAHLFKVLQDRFRVAWTVTALGQPADFRKEFDALMDRMDGARSSSLTPPERFFEKARVKIQAGHYDFAVDTKSNNHDRGGMKNITTT